MRIAGNRPNSCGGSTYISIFDKVVGISTNGAVASVISTSAISNNGVGNIEGGKVKIAAVVDAAAAADCGCCSVARKGGIGDGECTVRVKNAAANHCSIA